MNSWNGAQEFYDPETASSSGLSHVPSQPMSLPSPGGMISRESCLKPDTRNSLGTSGHVFEGLPARGETSSALFENFQGIVASSSSRLNPIDVGKINCGTKKGIEKRTAGFYNTNSALCQESCDLEPFISCRKNLFSKLFDAKSEKSDLGTAFRSQTPQTSNVRRSISRLKYARTQDVLQSQCYGSKK